MFDFDFFHILPSELVESLLALALCAIVAFRGVINWIFSKENGIWTTRRIAAETFFWLAGILLTCFLAGDLNRYFMKRLDPSMMIGLSIASAFAILAFATISFADRFGNRFLRLTTVRVARVSHLLLLVAVGCWFTSRMNEPALQHDNEIPLDSQTLMSEDTEYLAITDAGTQIPLFEIDLRDSSSQTRMQLANTTKTPEGAKVIPRGDANLNANCHGWVFTGGKYLLRGRSVDQILSDNGYSVQGTPEAGDVIVYRSEQGELLHTGIVSGILLDGTCIIESKWGISGRFLHQAEDQPYGLNYAFYRSERGGHLVTVIRRKDADSFLAKTPVSSGMSSAGDISAPTTANQPESELESAFSD